MNRVNGEAVNGLAQHELQEERLSHPPVKARPHGDSCRRRLKAGLILSLAVLSPTALRGASGPDDYWDGRFWPPGFVGNRNATVRGVYALVPTPSGELLAAGCFNVASDVLATNLAVWNGTWWHGIPTAPMSNPSSAETSGGTISSAVYGPDEALYVCGRFTQIGGIAAAYVARWDGTNWSALGSGVPSGSATVMARAGQSIYLGGYFYTVGGTSARCIAGWNGTNWFALNNGVTDGVSGPVQTLAVNAQGDLFVGGSFTKAGGLATGGVARWDGTNWFALGSGIQNGAVYQLYSTGNDLYAAGSFTNAGGQQAYGVARWDGTNWHTYPALSNGYVRTVFATPAGEVWIALVSTGGYQANMLKWDGGSWVPVGDTFYEYDPNNSYADVTTFAMSGNQLLVAGRFKRSGASVVSNLARLDGTNWSAFGTPGLGIPFEGIVKLKEWGGYVYAAGGFDSVGTNYFGNLMRWDGHEWSHSGIGANPIIAGGVGDLAFRGSNVYVTRYTEGTNTYAPARWDGTRWWPLGSGVSIWVNSFALAENNDVFVGGEFIRVGGVETRNVGRWDGTNWHAVAGGVGYGFVRQLAFQGSKLYVGGSFTTANFTNISANNIAMWNGLSWSSLGLGSSNGVNGTVYALEVAGTNLYVGGKFSRAGGISASNIARWNGSSWYALRTMLSNGVNSTVYAIKAVGTNLYVGGTFTTAAGTPANYVAVWDGYRWSTLGSGIQGYGGVVVNAFATDSSGLCVGGYFATAGGKVSYSFARYRNHLPSVTLAAPTNGMHFPTPGAISLLAAVVDPDATVQRVDFFANGALVGSATSSPWQFLWNAPPGTYTITATAIDETQRATTSDSANIFVNALPVAQCHNVTATADATCTAHASIDDGSFDPDSGDTITLTQSPPGPYPLGDSVVTLIVADNHGAASSCTATVTVNNRPPVVTNVKARTAEGRPVSITLVKLLFGASDPDPGQMLTVSSAGPLSVHGGTVVLEAHAVTYTPAEGFIGADTFSFTVADTCGGTATGTVEVTVTSASDPSLNMIGPQIAPNGDYIISFSGIPGRTYLVQRAPSVTGPWFTVATVVMGPAGVAQYVDTHPTNPAFYRAVVP